MEEGRAEPLPFPKVGATKRWEIRMTIVGSFISCPKSSSSDKSSYRLDCLMNEGIAPFISETKDKIKVR